MDGNDFSSVNWQLGPGLQVLALALLCAATVLVGRLQASCSESPTVAQPELRLGQSDRPRLCLVRAVHGWRRGTGATAESASSSDVAHPSPSLITSDHMR